MYMGMGVVGRGLCVQNCAINQTPPPLPQHITNCGRTGGGGGGKQLSMIHTHMYLIEAHITNKVMFMTQYVVVDTIY